MSEPSPAVDLRSCIPSQSFVCTPPPKLSSTPLGGSPGLILQVASAIAPGEAQVGHMERLTVAEAARFQGWRCVRMMFSERRLA